MPVEVIVFQAVMIIVATLFFTWFMETKDEVLKHAGLESNLLMGFLLGMAWPFTVPAFVVLVVLTKLIKAIR